MSDIRGII